MEWGSMSKFLIRLKKNQKKGISPVISTIILIVVALVIALLVGVFAFGLFTSQTKSLSIQSGNLYTSTGDFDFALKNPGATAVTITSLTLNGAVADNFATPPACTVGGV